MSIYGTWDHLSDLKATLKKKCGILEDLLQFLKEKAELDSNYGRGLKKLCKFSLFDPRTGQTSRTLSCLQKSLQEISESFTSHSTYIQDDLCTLLKNQILLHSASMKQIKQKAKKLFLEREKLIKKHISSKERYVRSINEPVTFSQTIGKFLQDTSPIDSYRSALANLNSYNSIFKREILSPMSEVKEIIIEKLKTFKLILQDLISSDATCIYSMKMHIDSLAQLLDSTNFESDVLAAEQMLIKYSHVSDEVFIAHSSRTLTLASGLELIPSDEDDLKSLLASCWKNIQLSSEDLQYFQKRVSTQEGRKIFIQFLNDRRKNGEFTLSVKSFEDVGKLFNFVLDYSVGEYNFSVVRQCIILSQTFCNERKEYLQNLILGHSIWSQTGFWEALVEESVKDEMRNLGAAEGEDQDEVEFRKNAVITSVVTSYIDIMASFNVRKNLILAIAQTCKQKFGVDEESMPMTLIKSLINID